MRVITFSARPTGDIPLIVHGQGLLIFTATPPCTLTFYGPSPNDTTGIQILFTTTAITGFQIPQSIPLVDPDNKKGISAFTQAWISIDAQNKRIFAGVGEARTENILYSYYFTAKALLESLTHIRISDSVMPVRLLRDPIRRQIPLIIRPTDTLSMNEIASGIIVAKSHLGATAHRLFDCVSGANFVLNDRSFPDFSKAIEYSINNPNGWCYKRLAEKSREFDPDHPNPLETYLRITIGENNGESPGIPYVMEIWPPKHYSPIHNHGGANAIIRVLSGTIHVDIYPHLGADASPCASADFAKDDITWLSPTLNQIHKLTNVGTETCVTIQCYMYDAGDRDHYDYFDYLDGQGRVQQYEPDSDMDFIAFKQLMQAEWNARPKRGLSRILCRPT
jgi:hypothetical protein